LDRSSIQSSSLRSQAGDEGNTEGPAGLKEHKLTMPKQETSPGPASDPAVRHIFRLVDAFCTEYLNGEYADLCRKLTEKLADMHPSPLLTGSPNAWACGIVRTIGWVNFLGDREQEPHMKLSDIDLALGVNHSTGQNKSLRIRKMLDIGQLDPEWWLPSQLGHNPVVWMIDINGFKVDVRTLRPEIQEFAFRQGLIPYIPKNS